MVLALVPAVLAWPLSPTTAFGPGAPLDRSYMYVLERAFATGRGFGPKLSFTYGPLGFLAQTHLFYGLPFALSAATLAALLVAANTVVIRGVRAGLAPAVAGGWGRLVAVVVAYGATLTLTSGFGRPIYLLDAILLAVGVALLGADGDRARRLWVALGALLGAGVLVLPTLGAAGVGIAAVAALARPQLRRPALALGVPAALVTFAVGWLVTGGSLGAIPGWLGNERQLVSGYASAMGTTTASWTWTWVPTAIVVAILAAALVVAARGRRLPIAVAQAVMTALVVWLLAKEGFVRQDGHTLIFFLTLPFVAATIRPGGRRAWVGAAAVVACLATGLVVIARSPTSLTAPPTAVHNLASVLHTAATPGGRRRAEAQTRSSLQASYGLPPAWVAQIGSQPVAIEPYEAAVTWAYPSLHLATLPTIQEYTAYTDGLDARNAAFYQGADAPAFVLAGEGTIDGRDQAWDPPATALALRCDYAEVASTPTWVLLRHHPGRCGHPTTLGVVHAGYGQTVAVPAAPAGDAVTASFALQQSLGWRVADLVLRPPQLQVLTDVPASYRLIPGTAGGPHLLSFPDTAGAWPVAPIHRLAVIGGGGRTGAGVTVTFQALPVRDPLRG